MKARSRTAGLPAVQFAPAPVPDTLGKKQVLDADRQLETDSPSKAI
jgi:hypothetical protein